MELTLCQTLRCEFFFSRFYFIEYVLLKCLNKARQPTFEDTRMGWEILPTPWPSHLAVSQKRCLLYLVAMLCYIYNLICLAQPGTGLLRPIGSMS